MFKIISFVIDEYGDEKENTEVIHTACIHEGKHHYISLNWTSYTTHTFGELRDEGFVRYMEIFVRIGRLFHREFVLIDEPRPEEYLAYKEGVAKC